MADIASAVWWHVTSLEPIDATQDGYVLVFAALTLVIGLFAVVLDMCYSALQGGSFLGLRHGPFRSLAHLVIWPVGSALFAWFGLALEIIQPNILGAVAAATVWTFLIRKAVASRLEGTDVEDPREDS